MNREWSEDSVERVFAIAVRENQTLELTTRTLLLVLSSINGPVEGQCEPSIADIAGWLSLKERTVQRHIAKAEATGWLEVQRRTGENGGAMASLYTLRIPPAVQ